MKTPLSPQFEMTETVKAEDGSHWVTRLTTEGRREFDRQARENGLVKESFSIGNGLQGFRYVRSA